MRIIKLGLISLVVFFLLVTAFSLLIPSRVRISKAIDINSEQSSIIALINDTAQWKRWYPGADTMSNRMEIVESNDSTVRATEAGTGRQRGESGWHIIKSGLPNTVTVQWYMDFHLRWYPWEKFSSLLMEKRYGPMMEKGLSNLKTLLLK